jgi:hypothetical protein
VVSIEKFLIKSSSPEFLRLNILCVQEVAQNSIYNPVFDYKSYEMATRIHLVNYLVLLVEDSLLSMMRSFPLGKQSSKYGPSIINHRLLGRMAP